MYTLVYTLLKMKVETKPFSILDELKTERDIDGFIQAAIEDARDDTDPSILIYCLGVAAQARGLLQTAKAAKVNRTGLYRFRRRSQIQHGE